jgi:hypothetical protein
MKAVGALLSRPAAYRVVIAAADIALAHLLRVSGNLYKLWNRPGDVLPIVPKEL